MTQRWYGPEGDPLWLEDLDGPDWPEGFIPPIPRPPVEMPLSAPVTAQEQPIPIQRPGVSRSRLITAFMGRLKGADKC